MNSTPAKGRFKNIHEQKRINYSALSKLLEDAKNGSNNDYQLKFVIKYPDDYLEVLTILSELKKKFNLQIPVNKVILMPEGRTSEEIRAKYPSLTRICMLYGFRLTPRLHIDIWGNERGV